MTHKDAYVEYWITYPHQYTCIVAFDKDFNVITHKTKVKGKTHLFYPTKPQWNKRREQFFTRQILWMQYHKQNKPSLKTLKEGLTKTQ